VSDCLTSPAAIAEVLRRAADDIEAMGDVALSPTTVNIDLQAVRHAGTPAERIATVDALSRALVDAPGELSGDGEHAHHSTPLTVRGSRPGVKVAVYTNPAEWGDRR
jgi:hypothetical protein